MSLITTILGVFGSGLGSLFTYFVNLYEQWQQEKQAAATEMTTDMDAHASDGALSVSDMQSAQNQIQDIQNQLDQLDQQQPVTGAIK